MFLAGIDVGSTGTKLALYLPEGKRIAYAYREYSIDYGMNGEATINPRKWLDALQSCIDELSNQVDFHDLAAIGISSANAMVLTDENCSPIIPAIMQLDKRGAMMLGRVNDDIGEARIFQKTGNRNAPGYQWGPTLKWLEAYENNYSKAKRIYNPSSYIIACLTGSYCMDITRAATTLLLNSCERKWDDELWEYFGLTSAMKPEIKLPSNLVGYTTGEMLFPKGIPVAAGGIDTICATLGLTAGQNADALILGSVGRFAAAVTDWSDKLLNTFSVDGSKKISMTPVNNCGTALKWVRDCLLAGANKSYYELNTMAQAVPIGSEGLSFFPFLNGASSPRWDSAMRGTFLGLDAHHNSSHMVRSVMEGVAFTLLENQLCLEECGCRCDAELYLGGGGARSQIWSYIFCNALNRRIIIPEETETETMGAAILGGMAAGIIHIGEQVSWNRIHAVLSPDKDAVSRYRSLYDAYSENYELLKTIYCK